jgi:hypothetical protein
LSSFQGKGMGSIGVLVSAVFLLPILTVTVTNPQTIVTQIDQTNRVSIAYITTKDPILHELYSLLTEHRALEKI